MTGERSPTDGKPFYCVKCRAGFGEFMACELPDCKLESWESAEVRAMLVNAAKRKASRKRCERISP